MTTCVGFYVYLDCIWIDELTRIKIAVKGLWQL